MADYVLVGLVGLVIGSFLNVVIWRVPRKESVVWPRSHCSTCKKPLRWYELIPVLSYLLQRGRCRHHGCAVSWSYPAVEVAAMAIFLLVFYRFGWSLESMHYAVLMSLLLAIAEIDRRHSIIPNTLVLFGSGIGLLLWVAVDLGTAAENLLVGAAVAASLVFVRHLGTRFLHEVCMGMGDVKLAIVVGLFLGWQSFWILYLAAVLGGLVGLVGLATGSVQRKDRLPFAPFIAAGALLTLIGMSPSMFLPW